MSNDISTLCRKGAAHFAINFMQQNAPCGEPGGSEACVAGQDADSARRATRSRRFVPKMTTTHTMAEPSYLTIHSCLHKESHCHGMAWHQQVGP